LVPNHQTCSPGVTVVKAHPYSVRSGWARKPGRARGLYFSAAESDPPLYEPLPEVAEAGRQKGGRLHDANLICGLFVRGLFVCGEQAVR
jgi:hypothetical protein